MTGSRKDQYWRTDLDENIAFFRGYRHCGDVQVSSFSLEEHVSIPESRSGVARIELPTLGVAVAIYGGFLLLTWFYRDLPLWVTAPIGALLIAWHGSLQHETIHHHPTDNSATLRMPGISPFVISRYKSQQIFLEFPERFTLCPIVWKILKVLAI